MISTFTRKFFIGISFVSSSPSQDKKLFNAATARTLLTHNVDLMATPTKVGDPILKSKTVFHKMKLYYWDEALV